MLENLVVDAAQFQSRMHDCVIGFSGQVPWWGLVSQSKQLYAVWEYSKKVMQARGEKMSQKRGHDNDEAAKFRITVELRQVTSAPIKTQLESWARAWSSLEARMPGCPTSRKTGNG